MAAVPPPHLIRNRWHLVLSKRRPITATLSTRAPDGKVEARLLDTRQRSTGRPALAGSGTQGGQLEAEHGKGIRRRRRPDGSGRVRLAEAWQASRESFPEGSRTRAPAGGGPSMASPPRAWPQASEALRPRRTGRRNGCRSGRRRTPGSGERDWRCGGRRPIAAGAPERPSVGARALRVQLPKPP